MRKTKRWLAGLLTAVLLLSLLPAAALAAGGDITRADFAVAVYDKFLPSPVREEPNFTDLDGYEDQTAAIKALYAANIINGTSETSFSPARNVTRWEAAVAIWRAAGSVQKTGTLPYTDVTGSSSFQDPDNTVIEDSGSINAIVSAITSLYVQGILTDADATEGIFRPNDLITVEEVETWLNRLTFDRARFAQLIFEKCRPASLPPEEEEVREADFPDMEVGTDCTQEEKTAVDALYAAYILDGCSDGKFRPDGVVTRAQAVVLLWRAVGRGSAGGNPSKIFNNVPSNYQPAFDYLTSVGVLTAADAVDGDFLYGAPVTEEEVTTWLSRFMTRAEIAELVCDSYTITDGTPQTAFTDIGNCTADQQAAINALAAAGYLSGTSVGVFTPNGIATRQAAAIFLHRVDSENPQADPQEAAQYLVTNGALTSTDALQPQLAATESAVTAWLTALAAEEPEPAGEYTITFDANGGNPVTPGTATTVDGKLETLPTPTRSGSYRFDGWFTEANGGSQVTTGTVFTVDSTIYAHWTYTGGSAGSGSGGSSTTTTTETGDDGSVVTTTTNSTTGTVTESTRHPDGSITTVETERDGSGTVDMTTADGGASSVTEITADGRTATKARLTEAVLTEAAGEAAALYMPAVTATTDRAAAPTVTMDFPAGSRATVEIPVEHVTVGTVAILVDQDGTETVIKTSLTTETGVVVTLYDGQTVKIVDNTKTFDDVPDTHWGAEAVAFTASRELFSGTGAGEFSPENAMNRAMILTVLARFDGADTSAGDTWYDAAVQWAVDWGISDGSALEENLTREQLATMLYRYSGSPAPTGTLSAYADGGSVSAYARDAMTWAVEEGLISGVGQDTLLPGGQATRAQVAAILMRYCQQAARP